MIRPRFVSSHPALCYDSKHDRVVRLVISVDERGRRWESYDGGPDMPLDEAGNASRGHAKRKGRKR